MSVQLPPKKYYLRKLRRGVSIRFNGYDHDGKPHWLIYDEGRNKFFVVGWPEYEMLSRWHLGDPKAIIEAVNRETTLQLDMKDFENLEGFLYRNYLVEQRWRSIFQRAKEQKVFKSENLFYWFIRYYLFFRVPLFHPDNFLNKTKIVGKILFSRTVFYIMLILGISAAYQIGQKWDQFTHTFSTIFNFEGLILYFLVFTVAKTVHEFGHAYMCKQYNVPVPTMGVAFLVFWPVLYTDTTQSWSLPSHQRMRIAIAGMWVETYFTILAALVWANVHDVTIQLVCYLIVGINWVSTLLINVSPFMRFDGYYVLSDLLKTPNLQLRAFALARWQIRNWLFGWEEPKREEFSPHMHWILVTYAFCTWIYRLIIFFGIALIVYHYFFKALGIILFIIEIFAFILRPIQVEFKTWYDLRDQFSLNTRTITTIIVTGLILILLFIPINNTIRLNATLSYYHQFMAAKQDALLLSPLPKVGTPFKKDETIVMLQSLELESNIKKANLEYERALAEYRRAALEEKYAVQLHDLESAMEEKKAEYTRLLKLQDDLSLTAPFNGVIVDVDPDLKEGATVTKNSWILDIANTNILVVEAYAQQSDFEDLKIGEEGYFYPANLDESKLPVKVVGIEPVNAQIFNLRYSKGLKENIKRPEIVDTPAYQASEFGGKIATVISEQGEISSVESYYRVLLVVTKVPSESYQLNQVQLGMVKLTVESPSSLMGRFIYNIKKIFVQESGI